MKNVVITGASRGIGLSLSKQYQQQGCTVYGVCRHASDELKASGILLTVSMLLMPMRLTP